MDEYEVDEAPEESGPGPEPEESPRDPEPGRDETPSRPKPEAPEEPAPAPEAPEEPREADPEVPPSEEGDNIGSDTMQDLIDAIGDLNQTITDAATGEAEQLPSEGPSGGSGGEAWVAESAEVDLTPVVKVLERTNELLEQQTEILATQHNDLLQLQANVNFVFLAVVMLTGVVIGCAVSYVLHDLWRA